MKQIGKWTYKIAGFTFPNPTGTTTPFTFCSAKSVSSSASLWSERRFCRLQQINMLQILVGIVPRKYDMEKCATFLKIILRKSQFARPSTIDYNCDSFNLNTRGKKDVASIAALILQAYATQIERATKLRLCSTNTLSSHAKVSERKSVTSSVNDRDHWIWNCYTVSFDPY